MQKCDAGSGAAAYLVEIPRGPLRKREIEDGAQPVARFYLCSTHADNVIARDKAARVHELKGWLHAVPCDTDYRETDE